MPIQAPSNPTLPQDDTPQQQAARTAQLQVAQGTWQWGSAASLPGIPVASNVPTFDEPTLEWMLMLVKLVLVLAKNQIAAKEVLVSEENADLDPALIAADKGVVAVIEAGIIALEAKIVGNPTTQSGIIADIEDAVGIVSEVVAVADLKNHADKLAAIIDFSGAERAAFGMATPQGLAEYDALFQTIPIPGIAYSFEDDLEFARLRLAGPNSVLIEAVSGGVPAGCAVTAEQYATVVPGDTLAAALAEGRLFQCDYKDLAAIVPNPATAAGPLKYITCPIALFALPPSSDNLVPVAIRCDPSNPDCPVVTPSLTLAGQWGWQAAKYLVQVADGNYHELFAHLARTHLVIEALAVATHRHLSDQHPVWALLLPHFEGTIFINEAAATSLIVAGGPIDQIFAGEIATTQQTAADARLSFDYAQGMLPTELAARGVAPGSALTDYPYRDDGLLVWQAIGDWVAAYLAVYYDDDAAVAADTELAAWAANIAGSGKLTGFVAPATVADLAALCTMAIFTASAQHAAVNFPQATIMEFAPAVTGAAWSPPPGSFEGLTKADWLAMLPPRAMAMEQLNVLYLLGSLHYRPLGSYRAAQFPYPDWFTDPRITGAGGPLAQFQAALAGVEEQIVVRNASRRREYPYLLPSRIPTSINI